LKILIQALGANMGGAMRHLTNFLPALAQYDANNEYGVLVREGVPDIELAGNVRLVRIGGRQGIASRLLFDNYSLNRLVKQGKYDALVSLLNFGPVKSPVPHILFQRNPLYYCPYFLNAVHGRARWENLLRRRLAVATMKNAAAVVTPSSAMAEMIKASCPSLEEKRFITLYHGFSRASLGAPLEEKFVKHLKPGAVKLFYPTHAALHKGFSVLFDILARLKSKGLDFVLLATVCKEDWPKGFAAYERQIKEIGIEENIVFIGRVPQEQMGALYQACDLMVYPSLCESFGFSMVEAMGHGLPIVAADTLVNREMCQGAALYYPPLDSGAGVQAILDALDANATARLKAAAQARMASFDWGWDRYAREFVAVIEDVAKRRCS
jgi:glycosyltransferase involved in cell wall biosynthesis